MADTESGEGFLLGVLNSTPVIDGVPTDDFADARRARAWLAGAGGLGTEAELDYVRQARQLLQAVVRGEQPPDVLATVLHDVSRIPAIADGQITWSLSVAPNASWPSGQSSPGTPSPDSTPAGSARAPTMNAACSSSTTARPAPPAGARWPPAATG